MSTSVIGVVGDVLWMAGSTDFIQGVNQGVLILGLERHVEVDRGFGAWGAKTFPVSWDFTPCMLDAHVTQKPWLEGRRKGEDRQNREDSERSEWVVARHHGKAPRR